MEQLCVAGLVEEIQGQALDATVKVSDLLRKVKLAAVKLQLDDATEWVDRELKGYDNADNVPAYRNAVGQLKAHTLYHGVQPVTGDADWVRSVCAQKVLDPVSRIEVLCGDGTNFIIGKISGKIEAALNKSNNSPGTEYYVHTPQHVFVGILDQVRNAVLDWAIGLEKAGILGEGISFTMAEKQKAADAAPAININNFTGHLHQGDVVGHQNRTLVASEDNSSNSLDASGTFQQLLHAVETGVADEDHRRDLVEIIKQMQVAQGTADYKPWFQKLVGYAADYATVLAPFLPALGQLVS